MTINFTDREIAEKPQDSEVILEVKGVSKKFCRNLKRSLFYGVQDIATELVGTRQKSEELRQDEFWALKDVSFQLRRGEALGLVGPNGSGKTTLLRIISGLIKPDNGFVGIKGRIAPLIALGAGFNPILTGRENIYANMSILGLSKQEIDERFQDVVDFAEIGEAIDAPLQSYSSGMGARLGFATAIHTEPEILLIDEVLAVGDIKFQSKCYRRLAELNKKSVSYIMVSHNPEAILSVCNHAIYILKGNVVLMGDVNSVMSKYEADLCYQDGENSSTGSLPILEKLESESLGVDIVSAFFRDQDGKKIVSPISGQAVYFCIECKAKLSLEEACIKLSIFRQGQMGVVLFLNNINDGKALKMPAGNNEVQIYLPYLGLMPGIYTMKFGIHEGQMYQFDVVPLFRFKVEKAERQMNLDRCQFHQPRVWSVVQ